LLIINLKDEEFRFETSDDGLLQDEPLVFRVCDPGSGPYVGQHQQQFRGGLSSSTDPSPSAEISIGLVYVDLNPLLTRFTAGGEGDENEIEGWFPLYDTLSGVSGELSLSVKLRSIGDVNPFRGSSAGVRLYPHSVLEKKAGYVVGHVFGFVEELAVADDPEYEWGVQDGHRQARSLNEARQSLMYMLDSSVRRRMCRKVLALGGNAVIGYRQEFDVEGDSGIVTRSYGTCVLLQKLDLGNKLDLGARHDISFVEDESGRNFDDTRPTISGEASVSPPGGPGAPPMVIGPIINGAHMGTAATVAAAAAAARHRDAAQDEVQLLTLRSFGPEVRVRIGGLVTARSVKYLGKIASKLSDQETRDGWWSELRDEIKSHAKVLCCSHVIGYAEASTIHDDVCILSITGTAATGNY